VCNYCRALVYASELQQISARAKVLETDQHFMEARDVWNSALKLLPENAKQAVWIKGKVAELENTASGLPAPGPDLKENRLVASGVAFVVSFALFIVFESYYGGLKFGIGF